MQIINTGIQLLEDSVISSLLKLNGKSSYMADKALQGHVEYIYTVYSTVFTNFTRMISGSEVSGGDFAINVDIPPFNHADFVDSFPWSADIRVGFHAAVMAQVNSNAQVNANANAAGFESKTTRGEEVPNDEADVDDEVVDGNEDGEEIEEVVDEGEDEDEVEEEDEGEEEIEEVVDEIEGEDEDEDDEVNFFGEGDF
jgi:hypothetical protein